MIATKEIWKMMVNSILAISMILNQEEGPEMIIKAATSSVAVEKSISHTQLFIPTSSKSTRELLQEEQQLLSIYQEEDEVDLGKRMQTSVI